MSSMIRLLRARGHARRRWRHDDGRRQRKGPGRLFHAAGARHSLERRHAAFGAHDVPRTLPGVTVLGYVDQLVEIEAVPALPADRA